jgi:tRNA 2-thiocytidine biosynthesis protein TtcA
MGNNLNRDYCYQVEHSISTSFRGRIWRRFLAAVNMYDLIREGDAIAVCMSGGKDSLLLAKCMQLLNAHTTVPFSLKFIAMDPGYSAENLARLRENAAALGIPLEIFAADIFAAVDQAKKSSCHVCASMRRGYLYKEAQRRGCNKIALGHHMNDVVETVLLGMMYCGEFKAMLPKLHSRNYAGMELIRPLYRVREADIIAWKEKAGISCLDCACRVTSRESGGKRLAVKRLLHSLEDADHPVASNIFSSIQSVNLDTLLEYLPGDGKKKISFAEKYDHIGTNGEEG